MFNSLNHKETNTEDIIVMSSYHVRDEVHFFPFFPPFLAAFLAGFFALAAFFGAFLAGALFAGDFLVALFAKTFKTGYILIKRDTKFTPTNDCAKTLSTTHLQSQTHHTTSK